MEKLRKEDIDQIMERCISLARRKPPEFFNFKKMKGNWGTCNWTDIELDPRSTILGTGIHECVHYIFPKWCETQVLYAESRILNRANSFDLARFLKYLSLKLYKTELYKYILNSKEKKKSKPFKTKCLTKNKK